MALFISLALKQTQTKEQDFSVIIFANETRPILPVKCFRFCAAVGLDWALMGWECFWEVSPQTTGLLPSEMYTEKLALAHGLLLLSV